MNVDTLASAKAKHAAKTPLFLTSFSLASVWFGTHVGGGFATGNQAIQYFTQYGWLSVLYAALSMAILAAALREVILLARNHNEYNYKRVFEILWQPYPKLAISFELFFYIIAMSAVGAAVAGAASLLTEFGLSYGLSILIVGAILLVLTIFGAGLVSKASTVMSIGILIASFTMYFIGIQARSAELVEVMTIRALPAGLLTPSWKMLVYAGFQAVSVPAVIACCAPLKTRRHINTAMVIGFVMNAAALAVSCFMLLGWQSEIAAQGDLALPNLYVCSELGVPGLYAVYFLSLFLAFLSTGVTLVFSLIVRLENSIFPKASRGGGVMSHLRNRRILIAVITMIVAMLISLLGLSNIIRYAYSYCGYLSLAVIILPLLILGRRKNKAFRAQNPEALTE